MCVCVPDVGEGALERQGALQMGQQGPQVSHVQLHLVPKVTAQHLAPAAGGDTAGP